MTTKLSVKVEENGGPLGLVLIGTVCDGAVCNAKLYRPGETAEFYVHGRVIVMAREATQQDVDDREG